MLIFSKEKLVFLSVPKTGTTAYESALAPIASMAVSAPPELKHAPVYRYNRFFRPMVEKFIGQDVAVVAVMREPISWLGSWYRYRRRPSMTGKTNATHDMSFDAFVQGYCQRTQPGFANVGSQSKFLEATKNGTCVTHLFRYEDQPRLIGFLQHRLGTRIELGRENVSPEMALSLLPETDARLRDRFAEEFALYASIP